MKGVAHSDKPKRIIAQLCSSPLCHLVHCYSFMACNMLLWFTLAAVFS